MLPFFFFASPCLFLRCDGMFTVLATSVVLNKSLRDSFLVCLFLSKLYEDFHMLCIMQINSCLLNGVAAVDLDL